MNQGHLRSILPQRGGVSPVDNNTVALFQFNGNTRDSIRGISHIGERYVLDFRPSNSKVTLPVIFPSDDNLTIEAWVYCTANKTGNSIFIETPDGNATRNYFVMGASGQLIFDQYSPSGGAIATTETITPNTWTHVAVTISKPSRRLYINGVLSASDELAETYSGLAPTRGYIGYRNDSNSHFNGLISRVKVWNRALLLEEVVETMNDRSYDSRGLLGYWKLNENEGTLIRDLSNTGNDGLAENAVWANGQMQYNFTHDGFREKGILVEEDTKNFFTNLGVADANATLSQEDWAQDYYGSKVVKVTKIEGVPSTHASYRECINSPSPLPYSSRVTLSFKVKLLSGDISSIGRHFGGGTSGMAPLRELADGWYFFQYTADSPAGGGLCTGVGFVGSAALECLITEPQVEMKSYYSTSYTEGVRPKGLLEFPQELIDFKEGTWSCWAKTTGPGNRYLFKQWDTTGGGASHFSLYMRNTGIIHYEYGNEIMTSSKSYDDDGWHHYATTWVDGTDQVHLYVDGERVASSTATKTMQNSGGRKHGSIPLGHRGWTYRDSWWNGVIDEVRVDKVARTEAEIQAWYYQGRNGW